MKETIFVVSAPCEWSKPCLHLFKKDFKSLGSALSKLRLLKLIDFSKSVDLM